MKITLNLYKWYKHKFIQMIQDTIRQTWCQNHERDSVSAYIHMRDDTPSPCIPVFVQIFEIIAKSTFIQFRSNGQELLCQKNCVLKNFAKFTQHLYRSLKKLLASRLLVKKQALAQQHSEFAFAVRKCWGFCRDIYVF